jgi:hypothetical protein
VCYHAVSVNCVQDPLVLRKKAADFRNGYKNWRQKKAKGKYCSILSYLYSLNVALASKCVLIHPEYTMYCALQEPVVRLTTC